MLRKFIEIIRLIIGIFFIIVTIGLWGDGGSTALNGTMVGFIAYLIIPRNKLKEINQKTDQDLTVQEKGILFISVFTAFILSMIIIIALAEGEVFVSLLVGFIVYFIFPNNLFFGKSESNYEVKNNISLKDTNEIKNDINRRVEDNMEDILVDIKDDIKQMKKMYDKVKSAVNKSASLVEEVEEKKKRSKERVNYWEEEAKSALQANNEDYARESLRNKKRFERLYNQYKEQVIDRKVSLDSHRIKLEELSYEIEEAESMKYKFIAERENASITEEINTTLADVEEINDENLKVIQSRLGKLKVKAESSNEFYNQVEKNDLEDKFEQLEENQDLNQELLRLKEEINQEI